MGSSGRVARPPAQQDIAHPLFDQGGAQAEEGRIEGHLGVHRPVDQAGVVQDPGRAAGEEAVDDLRQEEDHRAGEARLPRRPAEVREDGERAPEERAGGHPRTDDGAGHHPTPRRGREGAPVGDGRGAAEEQPLQVVEGLGPQPG